MQVQIPDFGCRCPIPMVPLRLVDDIKDNLTNSEGEISDESPEEEGVGEEGAAEEQQ